MDKYIAIIAYIAPYFLIPATFKYGLGVFGNLAGMVNDRSRGFFDRQRKFREGSRANARQKASAQQRFAGARADGNRFQRGLNQLNKGIAATRNAPSGVLESGALFRPSEWRGATNTKTSQNRQQYIRDVLDKKAGAMGHILHDDDLLTAGIESGSVNDVRQHLAARTQALAAQGIEKNFSEEDVQAVMAARRQLGGNFNAAAVAAKPATGTGYAGRNGAAEMVTDILNASEGDRSMENFLFSTAKSAAKSGQRYDLGAGFGEFLNQKEALRNGTTTLQAASDALTDSALDSQGAGAVLAGRGQSAENFVPALQRRLQRSQNAVQAAFRGGNAAEIEAAQRRYIQDLASSDALVDVASSSAPEIARAVADGVHNQPIHLDTLPDEVRDWLTINPDGTRAVFSEMRPDGTRQLTPTITTRQLMDHFSKRSKDVDGWAYDEMRRNYTTSLQDDLARQRAAGAGTGGAPTGPGTGPTVT